MKAGSEEPVLAHVPRESTTNPVRVRPSDEEVHSFSKDFSENAAALHRLASSYAF